MINTNTVQNVVSAEILIKYLRSLEMMVDDCDGGATILVGSNDKSGYRYDVRMVWGEWRYWPNPNKTGWIRLCLENEEELKRQLQ